MSKAICLSSTNNMESYKRNSASFDVPYHSIPKRIKYFATETPDKNAFVFISHSDNTRICLTYGELFRKSEAFGKGLISLGIDKGNVIGIGDEKTPGTLVAIFGAQMIGAIPVPFHFSRTEDIIDLDKNIKCSALILHPGEMNGNWNILKSLVEKTFKDGTIISDKLPYLRKLIFLMSPNMNDDEVLTLNDVINVGMCKNDLLPDVDPDSTAVLFMTSGSTGEPKIVPYTHYSLLICGYYLGIAHRTIGNNQSVLYNDRPFSWAGGYPCWLILNGGCRVILQSTTAVLSIHEMCKLISETIISEKCTCALLIAPFLREILSKETSEWFINSIVSSGQPAHASLSECVGRICNHFTVLYGMTETGVACFKHTSESLVQYENFTVGQPFPGVEMKIMSKDEKMVPVGNTGEIYVRSAIRFSRYLNHDLTGKDVISSGGWFKTNDLGHMSKNGDFVVDGRVSEMIVVNGKTVSPLQLESDIKCHPGVFDVVVSPVPDHVSFQSACASVILKRGVSVSIKEMNMFLDSLWKNTECAFTRSFVNTFPKYYLFCDKFHRTHNGKIDRRAIAVQAIQSLKESN